MARMGHDSSQAAVIYQHATAEADRAIAVALHESIQAHRKHGKKAGKRGVKKQTPKRRPGPVEDRGDPA
jgi:hypothetical protein